MGPGGASGARLIPHHARRKTGQRKPGTPCSTIREDAKLYIGDSSAGSRQRRRGWYKKLARNPEKVLGQVAEANRESTSSARYFSTEEAGKIWLAPKLLELYPS